MVHHACHLRGTLNLHTRKNCRLKKIDLEVIDTAEQRSNGKTRLGIYEVDGDTLTIIAGKPGDHLRPLSFDEPGKFSEFFFFKFYDSIFLNFFDMSISSKFR